MRASARWQTLATVTPGRGARPPHLENGAEGDHRFRDPDEQGAGGDRGPLALRRAVRADPRGDASHQRGAFAGAVRGRLGEGPARDHRHAAADPVRAELSGALAQRALHVDMARSATCGLASRTGIVIPACAWRWRPAGAAAPTRRRCAGPTRQQSISSSPARSGSPRSQIWWTGCSRSTDPPPTPIWRRSSTLISGHALAAQN